MPAHHLAALCVALVAVSCFALGSSLSPDEQVMLQFAAGINNFEDVFVKHHWQGWGKDSNDMCPPTQPSGTEELLCEPSYPGGIDPANMSWPGVVCTPAGTVLCISLPDLGLTGDISVLETLSPLHDTALIDLSGNQFAGTLPATLSDRFMASGLSPFLYLVLSNNSISGSIPPLWGDAKHGWKDGLSALYLDQNHLTGQLPQLWSDSKSLPNLTIMYAYDNMLTGPVGWDAANLPTLRNLVLLPGNGLCGNISSSFIGAGVVRQLVADLGGEQRRLANVSSFGTACPASGKRLSGGAIAGIALGSVAGALLAILLSVCCWRQNWFAARSSKVVPTARNFRSIWSVRKAASTKSPAVPEAQIGKDQLAPSAASDTNLLDNQANSNFNPKIEATW